MFSIEEAIAIHYWVANRESDDPVMKAHIENLRAMKESNLSEMARLRAIEEAWNNILGNRRSGVLYKQLVMIIDEHAEKIEELSKPKTA